MGSRFLKRAPARPRPSVHCPLALAILLLTGPLSVLPAVAQVPAPAAVRSYDIPAGPLPEVLTRFIGAAGILLVGIPELTRGKTSPGLHGRFGTEQGLAQLLSEQGLEAVRGADGTYTLRVLPQARGEQRLPAVTVTAKAEDDPTRTEGTGSYTTKAMTIGSKAPLSIRETPQSVSVITRQRIEDQNLTDLTSALNQAPGITVTSNGDGNPIMYSRGFQIGTFQFDGGAPFANYGLLSRFPVDLAEYDHLEVLRGADGMFAGAGDPGAVVSLARKRPLDHPQVTAEGNAGSWNNYRGVLDVTGPLGFGGKLRGRAVMSDQNQDFFYDIAKSDHTLLYGIVEADLTPMTLLTFGGSYLQQHRVPNMNGLPRYQSGADLHLPRSTCLCTNWSRWNFNDAEFFAKLDQKFGDDWSMALNFNKTNHRSLQHYAQVSGTVNPNTGAGPTMYAGQTRYVDHQLLLDLTLKGAFEAFGRRHQLVAGASYSDLDDDNGYSSTPALYPTPLPVDVFDFDPADFPEPATLPYQRTWPMIRIRQYGAYATLRLQLMDALHLLGGARYSVFKHKEFGADTIDGTTTTYTPSVYDDHGVLTPYGALVYDLSRQWSVYASYTDIFSSQSQNSRKGPPPGTPLKPIVGGDYQAGIKGELLDGALNASVSLYRIVQRNKAVSDPDYPFTRGNDGSGCCYVAAGKVESKGVDAELAGEILPGWQVSASYSYNLNRIVYNGNASSKGQPNVTLSPKHMARLWSTYRLPGDWRRLSVGGGVNAQTKTYRSGSVPSGYDADGNPVPPNLPFAFTQGFWAVFGARLAYQIDPHWSAAVNVNNLFDRTYYQTVGSSSSSNYYGEPRNFMLTLRGRW